MHVYKTTNLINRKIYIGKEKVYHSQYFGSGLLLKKAIVKYGKQNFKKEIIQECLSLEELDKAELEWIKKSNCFPPYGYNILIGNFGGDKFTNHPNKEEMLNRLKTNFLGKHHTRESKQRISDNHAKYWESKTQSKDMVEKRVSKIRGVLSKKRGIPIKESTKRLISKNNAKYWLGKTIPEYVKEKIRIKAKLQDHSNQFVKYELINPEGIKFITIGSLKSFLIEYKISKSEFYRLVSGQKSEIKGWKFVRRIQ